MGREKCEFCMNKIKYLGQITDHEGRKPDPNRAEAIRNMPTPDNVTNLQSFLGLANYYSMYIPKMCDLRAPLNELLKKGKNWYWTKEYEKAFKEIKKMLIIRFSINAL